VKSSPGNSHEKDFMKRCILSCWRTVDKDSADISHRAGHSRTVGRQTGKPSWLQLSYCAEALPDQMVSGSRMERLASRQVRDVVQWAKILWQKCDKSMQYFIYKSVQSCTELTPTRVASDVVRLVEMICHSDSHIQH